MISSIYILQYSIIHLHQHPYILYLSYKYYEINPQCYLINPSMFRTTVHQIEQYLSKLFSCGTVTIQNMYTYNCHNTKHIHVALSQHKTCTRSTITTQNMYTYHCHNTKHVHVPLSQYKTCTRSTITTQNMYTYHCHNTKRARTTVTIQNVHVPLSQYKTCTRTTVTIQNMYTYH